jgi:hypothetical protein
MTSTSMIWITKPPLQNTGTCYINNLNCNNINIPINGIITREYDTSVTDVSYNVAGTRYREHLTVPDCGVYIYSSALGYPLPLYYSASLDYLFNYKKQTITLSDSDGIDGTSGVGNITYISIHNLDTAYFVYPNYGIKVWNSWSDTTRVGSDANLNYYNRTLTPKFLTPSNGNQADYCQVYYNGVEIRSLQNYDDDYY